MIKIGRNLLRCEIERLVILTHEHIRKGHIWGNQLYIERLEGKIRECLFFYAKIFKNNSVLGFASEQFQIIL